MLEFIIKKDPNGDSYIETSMSGKALLSISQLNKGTAFSKEERHAFGLTGKLPNKVETLEEQVDRVYTQYNAFQEPINRNVYLNQLLNANQVLFYRLITDHLEEMLPTIYTPIVGNAVKLFNKKYMHPRGLYISYLDRDNIEEILDNRSNPDIRLIVVSDGEGVLGIGDQGISAMAIPVAKLMVYTAIGGINPMSTLPIMLDAGTNNESLLNDPLYLGWQHPRLTGEEYAEFIDKFINDVRKKFPHVFLHWEDFGRTNAYRNLITYQNKICSFNDDIQGTGAVALAAVLSAVNLTELPLSDQRIVVFGAGTAGMGVTNTIYRALIQQGLSEQQARKCFWLIDRLGLLTEYTNEVTDAQKPYLRNAKEVVDWKLINKQNISLLEVIENVKPTILIGTSAHANAFNKTAIKAMAKYVERPIIFALSNPPDQCEANPSDIIEWTKGRALIATGSPFPPIHYKHETYPTNQCNNFLAFPGIGVGTIAVKAKYVTNGMLFAASTVLSHYTDESVHRLLPHITQAREASRQVAIAVAKQAITDGVSEADPKEVETLIGQIMWEPHYVPYRRIHS